jgi:TPR repeat protein
VLERGGQAFAACRVEGEIRLREAAGAGFVYAQLRLGDYLFDNPRIPPGPEKEGARAESTKWYLLAADQGNADAMLHAANAYAQGIGVKQDPARARQWVARLVAQHPSYAERGNAILAQMTPPIDPARQRQDAKIRQDNDDHNEALHLLEGPK